MSDSPESQISLPWMSSVEASLVRTSRAPASAQVSPAPKAASGTSTAESLGNLGPEASSSKTLPAARRRGSRKSARTSPTLAIERAPWGLEPATLEPLIGATGSSSSQWPTPMARDGSGRGLGSPEWLKTRLGRGFGVMLDEAVRAEQLWPTPTTKDNSGSAAYSTESGRHSGTTLRDAVEWPTPTASSYGSSNNGCPGDGREAYATAGKPSLSTWVKGPLNPEWIEAMMGFPRDWSRIDGPPEEGQSSMPGSQDEP